MAELIIKRHGTTSEMSEVHELLSAAERADGMRPLSDHLWIDLRQGGQPGFTGLLAYQAGHEHLVAYCQVSRGNESWSLDLIVHPHHRYEMHEIGPELLAEAAHIIASEGGGQVHWWVFEPTETHAQLAKTIGLDTGRSMLQMRVALPLAPKVIDETPLISTRPFRVGADEEQWLSVNNRAFVEHPEQGAWTREVFQSREREPWFNANGFLLHEIDGQLAGFCWTKVHLDKTPVLGEIYVIAVDPTHGGKGLGRALTVAGLQHLSDLGTKVGMLFVDSENTRAVSMYNTLGFTAHHMQRAFVGDIGPSSK